jgi:hypothetical protein
MRKTFLAFALLCLACLASAYDWYNFSSWGGVDTVITAENTSNLEKYFVKSGGAQVSTEYEKLLFASGKPSQENFYGVFFDPPLNQSILSDLRNRTLFKWKGAQYVLLYFNANEKKVVFGIETNYTNESTTIACNWTMGDYVVNVSQLEQNLSVGQSRLRTQLDFLRGSSVFSSVLLAERQFKQDLLTNYIIGVLKIVPGTQQNNTFLTSAFYSQVYTVQPDAWGRYYCSGFGQSACDIQGVEFTSSGELAGFTGSYSSVMEGSNPLFALTQDCAYLPQLTCNNALKRLVEPSSWSSTVLAVNCPPGSGANNATNNTSPKYIYCFVDSHCNRGNPCEGFSCSGTGNETVNITIGNYSGNTSKVCVFTNLTGCVYEGACISTGTRVTDPSNYFYCNGSILLPQKEGGMTCSANYECKSNSCASGYCTSFSTPTPIVYPTLSPSPSPSPPEATPTPLAECTESSQCDDGNPCTEDYCLSGACKHKQLSGCAFGLSCREFGSLEVVNGKPSYCAPDGQWNHQKNAGEKCAQNYECKTYYCLNAVCTAASPSPAMQPMPIDFLVQALQAAYDFVAGLLGLK